MKKTIIGMAGLLLLSAAPALAEPPKDSETAAPRLAQNSLDSLAGKLADRLEFGGLAGQR